MSEPRFTSWTEVPLKQVTDTVEVRTLDGERSQICHFRLGEGTSNMPPISHEAEQFAIVLKGRLRMRVGDLVREIGPGDVVFIPSGVEHEATILEAPAEVLDVHVPPRKEFSP